MIINCVRFFGSSVLDARRLTPVEYEIMIEAKQFRDVDDLYWLHREAWANNLAGSTKRGGKPRFKKFDQFFDYERVLENVKNGDRVPNKKMAMAEQNMRLSELRKRMNKRREREKEEVD